MNQAGTVVDHAPELVDAVIRGDTPLKTAFLETDRRRKPSSKQKPKPKPAQPSTVAVLVADVRMTLQKAKASELSESVLKDLASSAARSTASSETT